MDQISMDFEAASRQEAIDSEPKKPAASSQPKILSVSDLNKSIRDTLEGSYKLIWLRGEISNFKPHSSGHWYFSLKDSKAQVSAVMFRGFNQGIKFKPRDGMEVIVRGKITVYEPRGSYQIFCEMMEPVGAGALQIAFEQLKAKLKAEGLFEPSKKRPLPKLPRHVAIVTSPTGAAIRDILNILHRRFKGLRVTVVPAVVQGDKAPASICAALELAQRLPDVDVMIVGRGGGSVEDMWCFNDEKVARAIAAVRVPIISAVGHEIDFTISDFVADLRAPTPSAAAELVSKNAQQLCEDIFNLRKRIVRTFVHNEQLAKQKVFQLSKRLVDPKRRLQDLALRSDELSQRLESGVKRYFEKRAQQIKLLLHKLPSPRHLIQRLQHEIGSIQSHLEANAQKDIELKRANLARLTGKLDSLSPLQVLQRGYSIAFKENKAVTSSGQVKPGDALEVRFAKGRAVTKVEKILND
jgi:exodeoxyribonuclease VII large subunit